MFQEASLSIFVAELQKQSKVLQSSFWEWLLNYPEVPLTITEGVKKALAAISQGYVAQSLYGCQCGVKNGEIKPE